MKVLLSAYACEPDKGSEPGVGWNWATRLAKTCDVVVITRRNNQRAIEEAVRRQGIEHISFYYFDVPGLLLRVKNRLPMGVSLYYRQWQRRVVDFAREVQSRERCDIIHHITYNEFRTPGGLCDLDAPFVWGPVGGGQLYHPAFRRAYFRRIDLLFEWARNQYTIRAARKSKAISRVKERAAAIVIADCSTERLLGIPNAYRLLETAYDLRRNGIKPCYSHSGVMNLLWVGSIIPRKGLKFLIEALGESSYRHFRLTVIGDGKDRERCASLAEKYGLESCISFLGNLSYEEVNRMYDTADVFLFTSLRDTSGNVVLEAMSHGVPTIAFNHHGVSEIVTADTGTLIDVTEYESMKKSFVEAIAEYDSNRDMLEEKGRNARRRIEERFSWDRSVEEMLNIYRDVIRQTHEGEATEALLRRNLNE